MRIVLGLLLLAAAVVLGVVGLVTGSGSLESTVFASGLAVGVVAMVGLRLVHGDVGRRLSARRLGRLRLVLLEETRLVAGERDVLAGRLRDERADGAVPG